jgi:GT2 family glycosyltransferase
VPVAPPAPPAVRARQRPVLASAPPPGERWHVDPPPRPQPPAPPPPPPTAAPATTATATASIPFSILICTRNRPAELALALDSIRRSRTPVHQIVVSDDSSDERTRELVATMPDVTYVHGPRTGLGGNRNTAVRAATGTHVLLMDDDVELAPEFLGTVQARLETLAPPRRARTIITGSELNGGEVVEPNGLGFLGHQSRAYRPGEPLRTVVINSTIFPRTLFDSVVFDEQLVYGYDEVDVATRAVAAGFVIEACPQARNLHTPSPVNRDYYRPYVEASRLYVTHKRRRQVGGQGLRADLWLRVAGLHLLGSGAKRGPRGIAEARRALKLARTYIDAAGNSRA